MLEEEFKITSMSRNLREFLDSEIIAMEKDFEFFMNKLLEYGADEVVTEPMTAEEAIKKIKDANN